MWEAWPNSTISLYSSIKVTPGHLQALNSTQSRSFPEVLPLDLLHLNKEYSWGKTGICVRTACFIALALSLSKNIRLAFFLFQKWPFFFKVKSKLSTSNVLSNLTTPLSHFLGSQHLWCIQDNSMLTRIFAVTIMLLCFLTKVTKRGFELFKSLTIRQLSIFRSIFLRLQLTRKVKSRKLLQTRKIFMRNLCKKEEKKRTANHWVTQEQDKG